MKRALGLAALALVACSQPSKPRADTRRELLKGLGEQIFLPRYVEFESLAAELDARAGELCDDPTDDTLEAVKSAWWASRAPWKRNETVAFGPYADPTFYGSAIDFWPCRPESVETVLAGTDPIDASTLGDAAKGLPAIEYLLYEPGLGPVEVDTRRCEYLRVVTADLASEATAIREAWDPASGNYLGELVDAGKGSKEYDSIEMALGAVVNRLVYDVEAARNAKLGAPLGNRTAGVVQPGEAESRFSGRSLEDVRDNLRGVEEVFFGADIDDAQSLAAYLEGIGVEELVPEVRDSFDACYAALDAIPEPLTESIVTNPTEVQAAVDAMGVLQTLVQTDVIGRMGLMLTFSDADGD